jgi:hypothetical protein
MKAPDRVCMDNGITFGVKILQNCVSELKKLLFPRFCLIEP